MSRSYLFIPGNNPAMLQNADIFNSDAVIIDLEDAVIINDKDSARILVDEYLKSFELNNIDIYIRINSVDTPFFNDDLEAIIKHNIKGLVIPKSSPENLKTINNELDNKDINIELIPIIEDAMAVINIKEIAQSKRVKALLLGAEDLSSDLEVKRTKEGNEILYARMQLVYVAKAYKLDIIDTPYTNTLDFYGLKEDALFARSLGFTAKALIHPNQVDIINEVFAPSLEDILWAKRVLEAQKNSTSGAFSLDGKMIDEPIIKRARKILEKASHYNLV